MNKKLMILGLSMSVCLAATGCSMGKSKTTNDGTDNAEVKEVDQKAGMYFTFDGTEVDPYGYELGNISYQGPDISCISRGDGEVSAFTYYSDKEVIFVYYSSSVKATTASDILSNTEVTDKLSASMADDLAIKADGATFKDMNQEVVQSANDSIERVKATGVLAAKKTADDSDVELNVTAYPFVADGFAGCVIGVVTDADQGSTYKDEVAHNTEVIMNTIVTK